MLRLRVDERAQPRSKNGQPPQRTTGVARASCTQTDSGIGSGCQANMSPIVRTTSGIDKAGADPEAAGHVDQLGIGPFLEVGSAAPAPCRRSGSCRAPSAYLGVHRAGPDRSLPGRSAPGRARPASGWPPARSALVSLPIPLPLPFRTQTPCPPSPPLQTKHNYGIEAGNQTRDHPTIGRLPTDSEEEGHGHNPCCSPHRNRKRGPHDRRHAAGRIGRTGRSGHLRAVLDRHLHSVLGPTHAYIQLFTTAQASSVDALLEGSLWSLLFGALAGTVFGTVYSFLAGPRRSLARLGRRKRMHPTPGRAARRQIASWACRYRRMGEAEERRRRR